MKKKCVLNEEKFCDDCGECDYCDLNPFKICDNCGKCIDSSDEYREIKIDKIDLTYQGIKENNESIDEHCCDCCDHDEDNNN